MNSKMSIGNGAAVSTERVRRSPRATFSVAVTLLLLGVICLGSAEAFVAGSRPLSKRSFFDIQCKGVYDKGIFARLDRICDDCYNLYREPQLHSLCSENCFSTDTFVGCLDSLQMADQWDQYRKLISTLHADTSNSILDSK